MPAALRSLRLCACSCTKLPCSFVAVLSLGALGDELLGAASDLDGEPLYIDLPGRWQGTKLDVSAVVLYEDAVGQETMKMRLSREAKRCTKPQIERPRRVAVPHACARRISFATPCRAQRSAEHDRSQARSSRAWARSIPIVYRARLEEHSQPGAQPCRSCV